MTRMYDTYENHTKGIYNPWLSKERTMLSRSPATDTLPNSQA